MLTTLSSIPTSSLPGLLAVPAFVSDHFNLLLAGAIILLGLIIGIRDLFRLSAVRAWAISSVCFDESIRRRILLITPVAILGIIVVSQLQHPVDAQDAVRQTIKVCLFATGMVVVIATIIMACTNLPKEIDSRVIYTVVTKPTTRLEIVIGKILGFAKVSALLLLIMGLFTFAYVEFRAANYHRDIVAMLADNKVEDVSRQTYQHYATAGLLAAKKYAEPETLEVLSRIPSPNDDQRWIFGSTDQDILIPFDIQPTDLIGPGYDTINVEQGAIIVADIEYQQRELTPSELKLLGGHEADSSTVDLGGIADTTDGPLAPTSKPSNVNRPPPEFTLQFLDRNKNSLVSGQSINGGKPVTLTRSGQPVEIRLAGDALGSLARAGKFFIQITGASLGTQYGVHLSDKPEQSPLTIIIPGADPAKHTTILPVWFYPEIASSPSAANMTPYFRGRLGIDGQQLRGGPVGKVPAALYTFRNAQVNPRPDGSVPFEFTTGIEKSGDEPSDVDVPTVINISVIDPKSGKSSDTITLNPESNRTSYFNIPASWLGDGNFNVVVHDLTPDHWAGVRSDALVMVVHNRPFALNLLKSLFVMWLLSMLVIVVSVFCSTFLSWPIAIVLTLVILLGKWGVDELGDSTGSGIGNQVATDLGFRDPADAKVVSTSVEALSRFLNTVSSILPDISAFGGTESVERGVSIPPEDVYNALVVLIAFGLPLTIAAYIILKNKEVAP